MLSHIAARKRTVVGIAAFGLLALPGSASAGRLIVTGHDVDHHCGRENIAYPHGQCHFFQVAVDYVRAGAPDPTKPVFVLDRGLLDVVTSLDRVYGPGGVPRVVFDPRGPEFAQAPITTDRYSAVIVASSGGDPDDPTPQDLNEVGSAPDSDAINARAADLRAFFDAGGGLFVNSGNRHGNSTDDPYYRFLPIEVRGQVPRPPFALTDVGRALGLNDGDVSCCPTHNTFQTLDYGPLRPVDIDGDGRIATLVGEAARFESLGEPPITPQVAQTIAADVPPSGSCVRRSRIAFRVRGARGLSYRRVSVYLDGRLVKRVAGRHTKRRLIVKVPHTARQRVRMRLAVVTKRGRRLTIRRTFKVCS